VPSVRQLETKPAVSSVGMATSYSNPGGGEFSTPVEIGHGAYSASCTMGTETFQEVKRSRYGFDHPSPLSAKIKRTLLEKQYILWPVSRIIMKNF